MVNIKEIVNNPEYDFLRTNEHLKDKILFLTLGGSHAYGTNVESSDIDIRGCTLNSKSDLIGMSNFEQVVDNTTDTTIYSFNKLISLIINCNPNTIEMLGCKPEHYLYINSIGQELIDNRKMFLSKRAIHSFGGYANQQLRRLENRAIRDVSQIQREQHILGTIKNSEYTFKERYLDYSDGMKLYIDKSQRDEYDSEIYMDVVLKHYPLRDYTSMWEEMKSIVKSYSKIGMRNSKAIEHNKLGKHMMHLVRLYLMCIDILEKEEIITFREKDLDLLMDIRNNKFLKNGQPTSEFYEMLTDYEKKLEYAKLNTNLPEKPNYKEIEEFVISVNERVIRGDY